MSITRKIKSYTTAKLYSLFLKSNGGLSSISKMFGRSFQGDLINARSIRSWIEDNGDYMHRLSYDRLTKESVVFDLGGYRGQFTSDLYARYNCTIFVFEPVKDFYEFIKERFTMNEKIHVLPYGLGSREENLPIFLSGDSSSSYRTSVGESAVAQIVPFATFLEQNNISSIDLLKVNIEGAEYDLLDHIIEKRLQLAIVNIQIQFHRAIPNYLDRYEKITDVLRQSHKRTYYYPFLWENWVLST